MIDTRQPHFWRRVHVDLLRYASCMCRPSF
ncbi:putative leader peptide [Streptomyces sp. LX-29]